MTNVLCLSPLGWSHHVWDLIVDLPSVKDHWTSTEFLETSFPRISKNELYYQLAEKLEMLQSPKIVVASSFGVPVLLDYLKQYPTPLEALILIDGFEDIPDHQQLVALLENQEEVFPTKEAYLQQMLGVDSQVGKAVAQIIGQNLQEDGESFRVKLGNQACLDYLTLYSGFKSQQCLAQVVEQAKHVRLFSSIPLSLPYNSIAPQDHLLMLTKPDDLKQVLMELFDRVRD